MQWSAKEKRVYVNKRRMPSPVAASEPRFMNHRNRNRSAGGKSFSGSVHLPQATSVGSNHHRDADFRKSACPPEKDVNGTEPSHAAVERQQVYGEMRW